MKIKLKKTPSSLSLLIPTKKNKLKKLLFHNELFIKKIDDSIESALIECKKEKNEQGDTITSVTFHNTNITKIDEKLRKLERLLTSIFDAPMLDKVENFTNIKYTFITKSIKQDRIILDNEIEPSKEEFITLDKYHTWNLNSSTQAHFLIAGTSGSGKSRVVYNILKQIRNITPEENIYIIDPKNDELQEVATDNFELKNVFTPNIVDDSVNVQDMEEAISNFGRFMARRYKAKREGKVSYEQLKHSFLIIDEFAALKTYYNTRKKDEKERLEKLENTIRGIAQIGRAAKCHLILIVQQPSAENLSSEVRNQMHIRLLMGNVINKEIIKMMFGDSEKELYEKEVGQGLILMNSNRIDDFNSPQILFPREI